MADRLEVLNSSASATIRVLVQNQTVATDENNTITYDWGAPSPDSCVPPMEKGFVLLHEKRRLVLETSSLDDILLGISNPSMTNTIKILVHTKKGGSTPIGFVGPTRNGIASDGVNVTLNAKQSIVIQTMPQ